MIALFITCVLQAVSHLTCHSLMDYSRCEFLLSDKQWLSPKAWHFRLNFIISAPSSKWPGKGIRGASRALAVSQPALTKAIKELEEGLSAQLFVRRSQGWR